MLIGMFMLVCVCVCVCVKASSSTNYTRVNKPFSVQRIQKNCHFYPELLQPEKREQIMNRHEK